MSELEKFFYPRSVVVIGASRKPGHVGNVIAANFAKKFKGDVYFVNPKGGELFGKPLYKSIDEIPADEIDMAVIVVPARIVPAVMRELPKKKVKAVVVISGGFAEVGRKDLQDEIVRIAREHGMRIIGPNCIGVYVPESGVDTIFLPDEKLKRPGDGHTAFITQSGAFGASFLDYIAHMGRGISKFISFGNAADVNEVDLLDYLKDDEKTRVIAAYLEGFRDGRGFFEAAKEATKKKPVIVIKANRNPAGAKAAKSHTAALATDDAVVDGMFKQARVIRAITRDEAYDYILAFELMNRPVKGKRVQVVTNGGGAGVMTCDAIGDYGLELAELSEETYKKLRETFPDFYVVGNPVDITGSARSQDYIVALKHVIPDPNNDAIILIVLPSVPALDLEELKKGLEEEIIPLMKEYKKPIFAVSMGGEQAEDLKKRLISKGIPTYDEPDKAVRALSTYINYRLNKEERFL